jgi:hypothetical protein
MRRCNYCFRYVVGQPLYCPKCGRSYDAKICSSGHLNSRHSHFCTACGSGEFSTPAPLETWLGFLSRWTLQLFVGLAIGLLLLAVVAAVVVSIDWAILVEPFISLVLMVILLYWLTTLLPGPIKRVGKAAARHAFKRKKGNHHSGH